MDETLKKLQDGATPTQGKKAVTFKDVLVSQERARLGLSTKGTDTLIEETTTLGGYLVPEEYSSDLIEVIRSASVVMPLASKYEMNTDTYNVPTISTGGSVFWEQTGGFTTKTNTDVTFGQLQLSAKTVYGLAALSEQLVEDSSPSAVQAIQRDLASAIVAEMDAAFLEGAGSGVDPITGITAQANIGTATMGAALTADDVADAIAGVEANNFNPNAIICHPSVKAILRKLKDTDGQYIWADPRSSDPASIFGIPVYATSNMVGTGGSRNLIVGDMKEAAVGMRRDITFALSEHANFSKNQILVRLTARVGFGLKHAGAFYTVTAI